MSRLTAREIAYLANRNASTVLVRRATPADVLDIARAAGVVPTISPDGVALFDDGDATTVYAITKRQTETGTLA